MYVYIHCMCVYIYIPLYIVFTSSPRMNATCLYTSLLLPCYTQSYMVKIAD